MMRWATTSKRHRGEGGRLFLDRVPDNAVPGRGKLSGAYINSALAKDEAEEKGADEAIMLDQQGHVAEGSGCNIFIVRNGTLVTPPITGDILEGITRRSMIQFAQDEGIPTEERDIDRTELYIADEAFFCGTGVQVAGSPRSTAAKSATASRARSRAPARDLLRHRARPQPEV